jgi:predicted nucleic acid-binding protein
MPSRPHANIVQIARRVQVVDSSVVIRATTCQDSHDRERLQNVIAESPVALAHVLAESYATLTRLPSPFRLTPKQCAAFLTSAFRAEPLTVSSHGYLRVLKLLSEQGISGGAVYDCLIAETAREHDVTLVSLDKRAIANYALIGAVHELL